MDIELLVPYRLRTVRLGIQATWLTIAALVPVGLIRHDFPLARYLAVLGAAAVGVTVVMLLPWRKLFERGWGMRTMYAWSAIDIVLITVLLSVVGPDSVEVFFIYALTTVFFAAAYPPLAQVILLAFTYASYLTLLAATGWPVSMPDVVGRLAMLGVMTFLSSFLSRELMHQLSAHSDARRESEQRASLLEAVARASRAISSLDSERVLGAVVDSALALGFDAGDMCHYDPETNEYRTSHARGLPEEYTTQPHRASTGVVGEVLRAGRTVVISDYAWSPLAEPTVSDAGFQAVIGSPVYSGGKLAAVLAAGTSSHREVSVEVQEAFELLASIAGRALENAVLFEEERRAVERLAELDRLKQDFLSTVSHEIRTPLTVIEGTGLTLEQHWDVVDDATRLDFIKRLNENARVLDGIITSLLDFSRLEAGRMNVTTGPVDLHASVQQVVRRLSDLHRDHVLLVDVPERTMVTADPLLLDRVLENLLSNATKYSPAGSGVMIGAELSRESVRISVSDNGPGIPEEELPRLTERFFRGGDPNSRTTKGIGLGLALVREILALHDTDLQIESEEGAGSRFCFELPRAERPGASGELGRASAGSHARSASGSRRTPASAGDARTPC